MKVVPAAIAAAAAAITLALPVAAHADTLPTADLAVALHVHQRNGVLTVKAIGTNLGSDLAEPGVFLDVTSLGTEIKRICTFDSWRMADSSDGRWCEVAGDMGTGDTADNILKIRVPHHTKVFIDAKVYALDADDPNSSNDVVMRQLTTK
jgi:hypothetical protein